MLNCSPEVAGLRSGMYISLAVLPRVTKVIRFLLFPAVLIDDHSLFRTNSLLLSRVHYLKTPTLRENGRLMGKYCFLRALNKVTAENMNP